MTIREFAKLDFLEKTSVLKNQASLLDHYIDGGNLIYIYYLNGFFIEATINLETENIVDIVPFKRGFFFDKRYLYDNMQFNSLSYIKVA